MQFRRTCLGIALSFGNAPTAPFALVQVVEIQVKYRSEAEVMKVLEIDTWRHLSKDKILQFAALVPEMDKEIALKVIEQFPEFRLFGINALNVLEKEHAESLAANRESQTEVHNAYREVRAILAGELERDDLAAEDRMIILDKVMETADREFAKDSENKRFLDSLYGKAAMAGGAVVALGLVVLGGRVLRDTEAESDEEREA